MYSIFHSQLADNLTMSSMHLCTSSLHLCTSTYHTFVVASRVYYHTQYCQWDKARIIWWSFYPFWSVLSMKVKQKSHALMPNRNIEWTWTWTLSDWLPNKSHTAPTTRGYLHMSCSMLFYVVLHYIRQGQRFWRWCREYSRQTWFFHIIIVSPSVPPRPHVCQHAQPATMRGHTSDTTISI